MNKRDFAFLENCFAAEIRSAMTGAPSVYQTKSARMEALADDGYVKKISERLNGPFPVTVFGWVLTAKGHHYYCAHWEAP